MNAAAFPIANCGPPQRRIGGCAAARCPGGLSPAPRGKNAGKVWGYPTRKIPGKWMKNDEKWMNIYDLGWLEWFEMIWEDLR